MLLTMTNSQEPGDWHKKKEQIGHESIVMIIDEEKLSSTKIHNLKNSLLKAYWSG